MKEPIEKNMPGSIQNSETLGHEERSQTNAKRAYRSLKEYGEARVPVSKFKPPRDTNEISVNRMNFASVKLLAELGTRNAKQLGKNSGVGIH